MGEVSETDKIYSVLKRLVENPAERLEKASNAREYAEKFLDIKYIAEKYYNTISAEKTKSPVTENLILTLKNDDNITSGDIKGIAQTLSYSRK